MSSLGKLVHSPPRPSQPFVPTVMGGKGMTPPKPVAPPSAEVPSSEEDPVSNAELLHVLQDVRARLVRSELGQQSLQDQVVGLQDQLLLARDNGGPTLSQLLDIRSFPSSASDSLFLPRELAKLPDDPRTVPVQLLDSRTHPLVVANRSKVKADAPPREPKEFAARKDGQHIQLGHELKSLLTIESVGHMEQAVYGKLREVRDRGELPDTALDAAVFGSLRYLSDWRATLVKKRVAEIAALLQFNDSTAREWAAMSYGPQNTLMGDDPDAVAFAQAKAAEPKPEPKPLQLQQQGSQQRKKQRSQQQQQGGGQSSQGKGSVRFASAGQGKGGAAETASAKDQ